MRRRAVSEPGINIPARASGGSAKASRPRARRSTDPPQSQPTTKWRQTAAEIAPAGDRGRAAAGPRPAAPARGRRSLVARLTGCSSPVAVGSARWWGRPLPAGSPAAWRDRGAGGGHHGENHRACGRADAGIEGDTSPEQQAQVSAEARGIEVARAHRTQRSCQNLRDRDLKATLRATPGKCHACGPHGKGRWGARIGRSVPYGAARVAGEMGEGVRDDPTAAAWCGR